MNPHEKAVDLIIFFDERIEQNCNQSSRDAHYNAAKQCAKIAADLIFKELEASGITSIRWREVKQEIDKL
jgi:hypothetical protein